ncbi:MAG: dethiobiotin synthase [Solirubrobacteraceae bacterium]|nr:dethiobiotin synthase [Solirubrobacteraceae bacterium]
MRGVFVTGTGTGVGKSVVSAALAASLVARGERVVASKPLLSGLDDDYPVWPPDHELLARITGEPADVIAPHRYGPAVSPHLAARWAGERHTAEALATEVRARHHAAALGGHDPVLVVEGAGGLLVPLDDDGASMADLAFELGLPVVVAAHPGLGTINHVQLTLEAARARNLEVSGVVLTPWPEMPGDIERDNLAYLLTRSGARLRQLPVVAAPQPAALASAGAAAGLADLVREA